jgi:LruC domain-containing protein
MKGQRIPILFVAIALLSLPVACRMDTSFSPASPTGLPADEILDVSRSFSGPFGYQTVLPVALNLTVNLYREPSPAAALERQAAGSQLIFASLWNPNGDSLFCGSVPAGGTLATVLSLPAAPQNVLLRLESPGYQTREVTIEGMVQRSQVNRVMGLLSESLSTKTVLPDSDGDGVPDIYDVDPLDPEAAFKIRTPASGQFTVAFEDLFPVPGDADYNDFVANYFLKGNIKSIVIKEEEKIEEEGGEKPPGQPIEEMLTNLHGEATAVAKVAGYSHKFGFVIEFSGCTALRIERVYYDGLGTQRTDTKYKVADKAVIWLFDNTSKPVAGKTATFDIFFDKGTKWNALSIAPYDPVLYVLNTDKDIHLVGQKSLSGQDTDYMDPNGYPWALLVPEDWVPPAETQYIGKAYPLFEEWRASKGAVAPYWYLYPASTSSVSGNHPPAMVSSTDSTQLLAGSKLMQEFHLVSVDPDPGDTVEFMSSPAPAALQDLYSLDAANGLVSFKPGVPEGDYLFYFWSVDNHGASTLDKPFKVTFSFQGKITENNPPSAAFNDPPITGSAAIGGTLTASYSFSDPDPNDAEGATTFQWYRFANGTDTTGGEAITGATAKSYTTVDLTGNSDSGKWLRVQVTPVDTFGAAGSPVLSGPVRVNTRIVIDTFPAPQLNDTYLTLYDVVGGKAHVLAEDDNGFPNQAAATGSSRIDVNGGLSSGTYYVKVSQISKPPVGSNYGIRVLDYDPGASYPVAGPANEDETVPPAYVDDAVDLNGVPTKPWSISPGQVIARSIFPQGTDVDWFVLVID